MIIPEKRAEIRRPYIVALVIFSTMLCTFAYAQKAEIQGSFFTPPERLGFFEVNITFKDYAPPAREIIFIFVPGGDAQQDATAITAIDEFVSSLNPNDSFNIVYPAMASEIPSGETFGGESAQLMSINRFMLPAPVRRRDVAMDLFRKKCDRLKNAAPIAAPQKIVRMIESALVQFGNSSKSTVEIIIVLSPPQDGYKPAESKLKLPKGITGRAVFFDASGIEEYVQYANIPRVSFLVFGKCPEVEKSFRELAYESNGFYFELEEDAVRTATKAAQRFKYDFYRTVNVSSPSGDVSDVNNDMWDFEGTPEILNVFGRCVRAADMIITVEDSFGRVLGKAAINAQAIQNPDAAKKWAELRAAEIAGRIQAYGGTRLDFAELSFLKREWGIDTGLQEPKIQRQVTEQNFTKTEKSAEKKDKASENNGISALPPHSVLEEIIPADSAYALFSSVPVLFKFIDSIDRLLREIDPGVASAVNLFAIENKVKRQLCLDYDRGYFILYHGVVGELALATDDISIPSNPQVTAFITLKHPLLFRMRLAEYRSRMRGQHPGLLIAKLKYNGHRITSVSSSSSKVLSYLTFLNKGNRDIAVVSNSFQSMKKAIDTADGNLPSVVADELFAKFRESVPYLNADKNRHTVFLCVTRAFAEKVKSKRYAFLYGEKRKCQELLGELDVAEELFKHEYPKASTRSIETLEQAHFLDGKSISENYAYDDKGGLFVSNVFGGGEYMAFIEDITDAAFPTPAILPQTIDPLLEALKPLAVGMELKKKLLDFDVLLGEVPRNTIYKLAESILTNKPSESITRSLAWDGYLMSVQTGIFSSGLTIGLGASKEQLAMKAGLLKAKNALKSACNWTSKKDILSWAGKEVVIGFKEARPGLNDFLCNSKGFVLFEISDPDLAKEFFEAFSNSSGDPAGDSGDRGNGITFINGFYRMSIVGKWLLISNDRDIFGEIRRKLLSPGIEMEKTEMPLNARIILGNNDEASGVITAFFKGREGKVRSAITAGKAVLSPALSLRKLSHGGTSRFYLPAQLYPPIYKRNLYPNPGSKRIPLDINAAFFRDSLRLEGTLHLDLPKRKKTKHTLEELESRYAANRFALSKMPSLALQLVRKGDPRVADFLETQAGQLGWSEGRRLVNSYLKGDDFIKICILKTLRERNLRSVAEQIAGIDKYTPPLNTRARKELYRTLLHFREENSTMDVYSRISSHVADLFEFEAVASERMVEMAPALAKYVLGVEDGKDGEIEIRQWLAAESAGTESKLGSCIAAISAIGKESLPAILQAIPNADERQRSLFTIAVLSMRDIGKDDLTALKANTNDFKASEFLVKLIEQFE